MMRPLLLLLITGFIGFHSYAQTSTIPPVDKSPLDVSYFPTNYTLLKIQDKIPGPLEARVIYSRPQKNNRVIFGELIEYGKLWRLGANEATEIEFFQNVKINNTTVKKGRYTLYSIPFENKWTMVINRELDTWGSFKYNPARDVLRVDVPVEKLAEPADVFSLYFDKSDKGFTLNALWDSVKVSLPISL